MRPHTTYICEVCEEQWDTAAEANACEAHGLPAPVPWLTIGKRHPRFVEGGVEWETIVGVYVYKPLDYADTPHEWMCRTDVGDGASALSFDPRVGHDAFRYDGTPTDLRVWAERMAELGFAESEASEWVREHVAHWRAKNAKKGTGR